MSEQDNRPRVIETVVSEDGRVNNIFNLPIFIDRFNEKGMHPEIFLCFIIKSIIDDFGEFLVQTHNANKEQFEAIFMENLAKMLSEKTRVDTDNKE